MSRIAKTLAASVLVADFLCLLIALFWMLWPYRIADIKVPIEILNENKVIAVGDNIRMRIILDKYTDLKPEGERYITCNTGNTTAFDMSGGSSRPVGHFEYIVDTFKLPPKFVDGEVCKFHFKNYYHPNPIRVITKEWESEEFTVSVKE